MVICFYSAVDIPPILQRFILFPLESLSSLSILTPPCLVFLTVDFTFFPFPLFHFLLFIFFGGRASFFSFSSIPSPLVSTPWVLTFYIPLYLSPLLFLS
jgi:hypothetical protein